MEDIIHAADTFQKFCDDRKWKFCFIGGIANLYWGRPRITRDVDLCLLTGFGSEEPYVDELLANYNSRIGDARQFALSNRILLLKTRGGIGIDVSLGGIPYEEKVIERSRVVEFLPEISLRICSAEDLIVLKAFADRSQDWADIESVIQMQRWENSLEENGLKAMIQKERTTLDWSYIDRELGILAAINNPNVMDTLHEVRTRSG